MPKFHPETGAPLPKFDPETGKQNWSDAPEAPVSPDNVAMEMQQPSAAQPTVNINIAGMPGSVDQYERERREREERREYQERQDRLDRQERLERQERQERAERQERMQMERMQGERAMIANMQGGPGVVTVVQQGPPVIPATALQGNWKRRPGEGQIAVAFTLVPHGPNSFTAEFSTGDCPGTCCFNPHKPKTFDRDGQTSSTFKWSAPGVGAYPLTVVDENTMRGGDWQGTGLANFTVVRDLTSIAPGLDTAPAPQVMYQQAPM